MIRKHGDGNVHQQHQNLIKRVQQITTADDHKYHPPITAKGSERELVNVVISSRDRDKLKYPKTTNFELAQNMLPRPERIRWSTLTGVSLYSIRYPHSSHIIGPLNDTIYLSEKTSSFTSPTMFYQRLPHGTFGANRLMSMMNQQAKAWTAVPVTNIPVADPVTFKTTPSFTYMWVWDMGSGKIVFSATSTVDATSTLTVQCPPKKISQAAVAAPPLGAMVGRTSPKTDVYITRVEKLPGDYIKVSTAGSQHNMLENAIISKLVIYDQDAVGVALEFSNLMIYATVGFTGPLVGDEWFVVYVPDMDTLWTANNFGTANVRGCVRPLAALKAAWPLLGYVDSIETGSRVPVTSINSDDTVDMALLTNLKLYPSFRVSMQEGVSAISFPRSVWEETLVREWGQTETFEVVDDASSAEFVIGCQCNRTDLAPLDVHPMNIPPEAYVIVRGHFIADQPINLRPHANNVFMRLRINNKTVGRYQHTGDQSLRQNKNIQYMDDDHDEKYFAQWYVDTPFGYDVVRYADDFNVGSFEYLDNVTMGGPEAATTTTRRVVKSVEFSLVDHAGDLTDTQGHDWDCVLQFKYETAGGGK